MCQIITLKTTKSKLKKIINNTGMLDSLEDLLREKGGDYYGACLLSDNHNTITNSDTFEGLIKEILFFLKETIKKKDRDKPLQLLLFSRQQPEMELGHVEEQPYYNMINSSFIFAVHGTIHNDKELAIEYGVEIEADTEVLQYMPIDDWHKAEGTFTVIGVSDCGLPMIYENGLKVWKNKLNCCEEHLADVVSTGNLSFLDPVSIDLKDTGDETPSRVLMASFSGGMDIALSTYQALSTGKYHALVLNYFAWGSKAEEIEIMQLEKFNDFYSSEFPDVIVTTQLREAEFYFDEYFKINDAPFPKISLNNNDAVGDEKETESPLAYVPYRNTQFAMLLASIGEADDTCNVDILFGLNLSEGMVFMDNSEGWLETASNMVKYGGKDPRVTMTYNVIAPYFARTKTNMLKDFKEDHGEVNFKVLLELSTSCYYPEPDGTPCGKCGSCILREKAVNKLKDNDVLPYNI